MKEIKLFLLFILFSVAANAQDYPAAPQNYVTDEADVLSESQESALNSKLKAFEDSTSNQIFVYLTNSLNGKVMSELCQEIFHNWKIGAKGKNNGVLIGVFVDDHKFRIHTGYGLEGALPDILTKRIQDEDMKPHFKSNDYFTGIDKGIDKLIYYSAHEFEVDSGTSSGNRVVWEGFVLGFVPNIILLLLIWYYSGKKLKKDLSVTTKAKKNKIIKNRKILLIVSVILAAIPCVGAIVLFITLAVIRGFGSSGGGGGGSWSSSSDSDSSSSWSSSDSGSDFSGGGGGDSGGGGSDSDW